MEAEEPSRAAVRPRLWTPAPMRLKSCSLQPTCCAHMHCALRPPWRARRARRAARLPRLGLFGACSESGPNPHSKISPPSLPSFYKGPGNPVDATARLHWVTLQFMVSCYRIGFRGNEAFPQFTIKPRCCLCRRFLSRTSVSRSFHGPVMPESTPTSSTQLLFAELPVTLYSANTTQRLAPNLQPG